MQVSCKAAVEILKTINVSRIYGEDTAAIVLVTHLFSWIVGYCGSRTLVNITEASLCVLIAERLHDTAHDSEAKGNWQFKLLEPICLSTLCIWIRPTSVLILASARQQLYAL